MATGDGEHVPRDGDVYTFEETAPAAEATEAGEAEPAAEEDAPAPETTVTPIAATPRTTALGGLGNWLTSGNPIARSRAAKRAAELEAARVAAEAERTAAEERATAQAQHEAEQARLAAIASRATRHAQYEHRLYFEAANRVGDKPADMSDEDHEAQVLAAKETIRGEHRAAWEQEQARLAFEAQKKADLTRAQELEAQVRDADAQLKAHSDDYDSTHAAHRRHLARAAELATAAAATAFAIHEAETHKSQVKQAYRELMGQRVEAANEAARLRASYEEHAGEAPSDGSSAEATAQPANA